MKPLENAGIAMKSKLKVHFMSERSDWRTPIKLYQELDNEFNFDFDPAPYMSPHKWNNLKEIDGLKIEWKQKNFINPPYGRELPKWIKKGYEESLKGKLCVFLIPSRTDTKWWHEYVMKAKEIRFIKGRLKFDDQKNPAPFPSCIAVFDGRKSI